MATTLKAKVAKVNPAGPAELQAPLVHLNGTSGEELLRVLQEAAGAVFKARNDLSFAAPNQRDFYPLEDGAWLRALHEYSDRSQKLAEVEAELDALALAVATQVSARQRSRPAVDPSIEVAAPADLPPGDHVVEAVDAAPERLRFRLVDRENREIKVGDDAAEACAGMTAAQIVVEANAGRIPGLVLTGASFALTEDGNALRVVPDRVGVEPAEIVPVLSPDEEAARAVAIVEGVEAEGRALRAAQDRIGVQVVLIVKRSALRPGAPEAPTIRDFRFSRVRSKVLVGLADIVLAEVGDDGDELVVLKDRHHVMPAPRVTLDTPFPAVFVSLLLGRELHRAHGHWSDLDSRARDVIERIEAAVAVLPQEPRPAGVR